MKRPRSLVPLIFLAAVLASCATDFGGTEDPALAGEGGAEDDELDVRQTLAAAPPPAGSLRVVQCNIYYGGKYTNADRSRVTWSTATRFAQAIRSLGQVAVIGMQEITGTDVRDILARETGRAYQVKVTPQGIGGKGSGIAIYYRPDLVTLEADLGSTDLEKLDSGYVIRFMGQVFRATGTTRRLGFFSGKLVWDGAVLGGHEVTDSQRAAEARRLRGWINKVMAPHASRARVVATDLNGRRGSETWKAMTAELDDGGATQYTHNSFQWLLFGKRLDYLFWDHDSSTTKQSGGFAAGPSRSAHFGSDHRFVWADVRVH